ncbi:MAG: [Fe-Fe] hydrogenase large subunit C-terminal domain-containing protein, partial [Oscillospiraceae bacterium]
IQNQYPIALKYFAIIMSPMKALFSKLKQEHPDCYTVFIGPCISKKDEAGRYENIVDCVLTFEELTEWFSDEGVTFEDIPDTHEKGRARLFPTAGGILRTMDLEDDFSYVSVDGVGACITALNDIELGNLDNCFIEMSACRGSCIGGPAMDKDKLRHVSEYVRVNRTASHKDFSVNRPLAEAISKDFPYEGVHKQMPGSLAIKEILAKMGKTSPEQELNCGSCGYNTCREKAIAVLMGKADLSMCLPYLKEKAESFSDKIINNTPNGIFVLNEKLEIQQMNSAAGKIFNIKNTCEAVGKPVVDILDPTDYLLTMTGIPNVYEKKRFLTEYEKYVEETIIFDRDYHIIMSIMKDVTDEEHIREKKDIHSQRAIEITDRVVEKQMRIVQEIASLLGETTAETKIALTKLKETLTDE